MDNHGEVINVKSFVRRIAAAIILVFVMLVLLVLARRWPYSAAAHFSIQTVYRFITATMATTMLLVLAAFFIWALLFIGEPMKRFNDTLSIVFAVCLPLGTVMGMLVSLTPTQFGIVSGLFSFAILFSLVLPGEGLKPVRQMFRNARKIFPKEDKSEHPGK